MTQPTQPTSLRDLCGVLHRHKGKMALFFCLVMGGVAAATVLSPKTYRSQAKLFLRLGRENATLDPTATIGQSPVVAIPPSREQELNSATEILKSRYLLEKVVDAIGTPVLLGAAPLRAQPISGEEEGTVSEGPETPPTDRNRAVVKLAKMLEIEAVKRSAIIQVTCQCPSPALAQAIVSKLVDLYLEQHILLNRTQGADQFLAVQAERLQSELTRLEERLRNLKNETGLYAPDEQRQILLTRIGRLQDDLAQTTGSLAATEAELRALRHKLAAMPETHVVGLTKGFPNEAAQRMREQFFALQMKEQELLARFPEQHPDVKQIRQQTASAKEVLAREEQAREQVTTGPSRTFEEAQISLVRLEPQLASLQARAASLKEQLVQEHAALRALNDNEVRLATLQREVSLKTVQCRKYAENLEQAQLDEALKAGKFSNINIVQPATYEIEPVGPRLSLNLALALVFAVFGSAALAWLAEQRFF